MRKTKKQTVKHKKVNAIEIENNIEQKSEPTEKNISDEKTITEKIKEVADVQTGEALPKGNTLEQSIEGANASNETDSVPTTDSMPTDRPGVKPGTKRGKYKKNKKEFKEPAVESQRSETRRDPVVAMVNGFAVPLIAAKTKKEFKQIVITKEQEDELQALLPPDSHLKPSWGLYFTGLIAFVIQNTFMAEKVAANRDDLKLTKDEIVVEIENRFRLFEDRLLKDFEKLKELVILNNLKVEYK